MCHNCGHYQLQDLPLEFIKFLYEGEYFNLESAIVNEERADFIKSYGVMPNQKILDVGGGTNSSFSLFREQEYTILDPQKPKNEGTLHIDGLVSDSALLQNHYDYIFAFHIIEHLNRPFEDLIKLQKSLKNKGKFFIEIPDADYYAREMPHYLYFFQHINIFTRDTIVLLLTRSGFRIVSFSSKHGRILIAAEKVSDNSNKDFNYEKDMRVFASFPSPEFFIDLDLEIIKEVGKYRYEKVALLGCGGSAALLINHCPRLKSIITDYHDSDIRKFDKYMPGTEIAIKKLPVSLSEEILWLSLDLDVFIPKFFSENRYSIDLALLIRKFNNYGA
jgi:hypothetical protein